MIRMAVAEELGELGYTVLEAIDGKSALRVLQSRAQVDLLLTDVGLPGGMNGRQIADVAHTTSPDLKVLFISGYAENALIGEGQLDRGMAVLTKPFSLDELEKRIREMLA